MRDRIKIKKEKQKRRHKRVRAKVKGTVICPRLSVFRSSKHIYIQLIDDEKGRTLAASSDLELKNKKIKMPLSGIKKKTEIAYQVGQLIAKKALEKKIKKVIFDRGGYKYHGRIKAVAEGAREGGLSF